MSEKEIEVRKEFTMIEISIRLDSDGKQHPIIHRRTATENPHTIESLPWGELLGRTITSVCMDDGRLVIGLSTKGSRP